MENTPILAEDHSHCLNCEFPLSGNYCGNCGQEVKDLRRPFFKLSREAVQSLFELDGRAYRTLFYLLTKPAFLCHEYFNGRRIRYSPPLRLFLVISVSFFLLVSLYSSIQSFEEALATNGEASLEEASPSANDESLITIETGLDEEDEDDLQGILNFVDRINLPFFDEQTNANLRRAMGTQAEVNLNALLEDPRDFLSGYLEYITIFILVMIPLLALIQKIIYIRSGHYYVEHLVLTLHNHAFVIFIVFVNSLVDMVATSAVPIISTLFNYLENAIYIWMWVYLYLSLKKYFHQGHGITLVKFFTTTVLYTFALSFGIFIFSGILFFLF